VELKFYKRSGATEGNERLNRTKVELKSAGRRAENASRSRLNRTKVELKLIESQRY